MILCSYLLPKNSEKNRIERFTESLIHESLHNQLTAVEQFNPLFVEELLRNDVYSPWKGEGRNERGLLHAVYVFSCLYKFWSIVSDEVESSSVFAKQRCLSIFGEMQEAFHLNSYQSLTKSGQSLSNLCLKDFK